jgi:hypothetical protein
MNASLYLRKIIKKKLLRFSAKNRLNNMMVKNYIIITLNTLNVRLELVSKGIIE